MNPYPWIMLFAAFGAFLCLVGLVFDWLDKRRIARVLDDRP
jgi:hypothetical protein